MSEFFKGFLSREIVSLTVMLAVLLARLLFAPYELPVGIVMSFLGGPFFIFLLLRRKRGKLHA